MATKKVLLVEDDDFLSDLIYRRMIAGKYECIRASNGEDAIKLVAEQKPDIVLLDVLLPGIDGFEILRRLKAEESSRKIPVIFLSNLGQKDDLEKGKKLGAVKFLIKATVSP